VDIPPLGLPDRCVPPSRQGSCGGSCGGCSGGGNAPCPEAGCACPADQRPLFLPPTPPRRGDAPSETRPPRPPPSLPPGAGPLDRAAGLVYGLRDRALQPLWAPEHPTAPVGNCFRVQLAPAPSLNDLVVQTGPPSAGAGAPRPYLVYRSSNNAVASEFGYG